MTATQFTHAKLYCCHSNLYEKYLIFFSVVTIDMITMTDTMTTEEMIEGEDRLNIVSIFAIYCLQHVENFVDKFSAFIILTHGILMTESIQP